MVVGRALAQAGLVLVGDTCRLGGLTFANAVNMMMLVVLKYTLAES